MGLTVITSDMVSTVFASGECGLLLGDAREVLGTWVAAPVDGTVGTPPYYSGRRHVGDTIHEIGSERTVEEYVEALASVGREVYRVTRPTGSYWLNLDDKCERKEWLGIPWRVLFAMPGGGGENRKQGNLPKPKNAPSGNQGPLPSCYQPTLSSC